MFILRNLVKEFNKVFPSSKNGRERCDWFIYTLLAIIIPFTSSKSSNLLRCLHTIFDLTHITKRRFYTFMASPKIPWAPLWTCLWKLIPDPLTNGRLLIALDDFINPKTGKKIFACHKFFDHAAKHNQSRYPWSQNVVSIGLLSMVKGRWACLPMAFRFYHLKKNLSEKDIRVGRQKVQFQTKFEQATEMLLEIHNAMLAPIINVTDSWFGNNGLWKPMRKHLGHYFHMISRLRSNINLYDLPPQNEKRRGRPKKYGRHLGNASCLASLYLRLAKTYLVNLYGKTREVEAFDQVLMLKTLKCPVRVVWIFRKTRWVALFSTNLSLSIENIIEYYGARWKIEAGFKELKQEIGSSKTQCRNPQAVINHLHFCMMATSLVWIYGMHLGKTPIRRHAVKDRAHFAFSDVRRLMTESILNKDFHIICPTGRKSIINSIAAALLRMAA